MPSAFLVRASLAGAPFTTEDVPASPGAPYIERASMFALMNEAGSERIVRVTRVEVVDPCAYDAIVLSDLTLQRTTAQSGGVAVAPTQMDTADAALPAQVLVAVYPTVTTTLAPLRRVSQIVGLSPATALRSLVSRAAPGPGPLGNARAYTLGDGETQGIVLREGQGICAYNQDADGALPSRPMDYRVVVNVGSTVSHVVSFAASHSRQTPLWGIFNGSGSGVVLTVGRIQAVEHRSDDGLRAIELASISALRNGSDVAPVYLDTAGTTLSSGVKVRLGSGVTSANVDAQQFNRSQRGGDTPYRRRVVSAFVRQVAAGGLVHLGQTGRGEVVHAARTEDGGEIVLREGDGLALLQRVNGAGVGGHEVVVTGTVEDTGSGGGGGGEHAYTFFG